MGRPIDRLETTCRWVGGKAGDSVPVCRKVGLMTDRSSVRKAIGQRDDRWMRLASLD